MRLVAGRLGICRQECIDVERIVQQVQPDIRCWEVSQICRWCSSGAVRSRSRVRLITSCDTAELLWLARRPWRASAAIRVSLRSIWSSSSPMTGEISSKIRGQNPMFLV